jgi:hypothetical protein
VKLAVSSVYGMDLQTVASDNIYKGSATQKAGCPRRAAICARGGKAFELYYVGLHHPRQTEGGLTRRTSLDRGLQRTFVFWRQIRQTGSTEWRNNSLKN